MSKEESQQQAATSTPFDTYDPNFNYDELIQRQQNEIDIEIRATQPLVGDLQSVVDLLDEYTEYPGFQAQITNLSTSYSHLRRIRKDGNCLYRAFAFGYCEYLLKHKEDISLFGQCLETTKKTLVDVFGYPEFTVDDFYSQFVELLEELAKPMYTVDDLVASFNVQANSDYWMVFMRMTTAKQLMVEEDRWTPFLELSPGETIKDFCSREVEPPGKEADHVHIMALTSATMVPLVIHHIDPEQSSSIPFPEDTLDHSKAAIHLLYRPGHYDVLYPKPV